MISPALHDEDDGDMGWNTRHVTLDGHPDKLYWVWDTGLLEHINRNEQELAVELEGRMKEQDRAAWVSGSIEDGVMEGHRLAQRLAYGDLGSQNPSPIGPAYEQSADTVVETQVEKAGVRLAHLLDECLQ